jgi:hypothetical protein
MIRWIVRAVSVLYDHGGHFACLLTDSPGQSLAAGTARIRSSSSQHESAVTRVPPTNTFHLGFGLTIRRMPCRVDSMRITRPIQWLNGEHKAGPLARISLRVPPANLGPLCTSPTGISEDKAAEDPTGLTFRISSAAKR